MKSYKYNRHTIGALCLSVICHLLLWGAVSYFHQPPIEQLPPLIPLGGPVPSWEPRHLPRPVKSVSVQAAAPRVMVIGRVQVTVPMKRRVSVGSGLESADPMETLATPMEAAELLPSAGASHSRADELLEGLSSGEAVSDLTPRVNADRQGGILDDLRGHIRVIIVILLIVVLVLYVMSRKADQGFKRFPFNDDGFGD